MPVVYMFVPYMLVPYTSMIFFISVKLALREAMLASIIANSVIL